jgi:hypothetical protein
MKAREPFPRRAYFADPDGNTLHLAMTLAAPR